MARLEFGEYEGSEGSKREAKVTLSRRNLLALLHKLDMPGSYRRLENNLVFDDEGEYVGDELVLVLCCEDDDEHYADDRRKGSRPGEMHPDTEAFVAAPIVPEPEPCPDCGCPGEKFDGHVCEEYESSL